jgi:hypothetical protein
VTDRLGPPGQIGGLPPISMIALAATSAPASAD